jgi:hypothetical protein
VTVDEKAVAAMSQHDGHSLIRTNDPELTFAGIADSYRQVLAAPSDLYELQRLMDDAAMIDDEDVRAFVCLAAFGLRSVVSARTGKPWQEVCAELVGIRLVTFVEANGTRHRQMAISSPQRELLELLELLGLETSSGPMRLGEPQHG